MTALKKLLLKRIAATGPISLADYMAECLMHPQHGYYQNERVFGAGGDFITAPEVNQMFGEMLGLWVADRWAAMGRPAAVNLIELGPGRGTLMADMLRAAGTVPGFKQAATIRFVEVSRQLRAAQAEKVPAATWHDDVTSLPDGPAIIVANEFFDALPIHQFQKHQGIWLERCVGAEGSPDAKEPAADRLGFTLTQPGAQFGLVPDTLRNAPDGAIVEVCPAALSCTAVLSSHIARHGGAALFIDYGYTQSAPGDTFQALKKHEYTDPFDAPGTADLTAHVAFDRLAAAATDTRPFGAVEQGAFLMAIGLGQRAQQLAAGAGEARQADILSALKRLTAAEEMGSLFKVLALQHKSLPPPPGF
jgi:NADH dehydrogenase [ubiquinone] 1 alpha subcomplex assembly factor 7